jgi:hypothetical protein
MFADLKDEASERAEECRREAARAINTIDVLAWLSLADEWRKLSQSTVVDQALRPRQTAHVQARSLAPAIV